MAKSAITRTELVARANKFGLSVEGHSPGGSGTYYEFSDGNHFINHTEHGLAAADSFLDGFIFAQRVFEVGEFAKVSKS